MPKFRYSLDSGTSWVVVDDDLPFNIPADAEDTVIVEPIGAAVSNVGTVNGNFLTLTYDAADEDADVAAFTNTAGTLYWCLTNSMTPPAGSAIIAGTGFIAAGNVGTVPGSLAITLPSRSGADDIFMHAIVDGAQDTNIATVRVYIGTASAFATISSTAGNPTIHNYTDAEGTWRAYEFTENGSFTVGTGGGIGYEGLGGGGGGGGGGTSNFVNHGGGGAGGYSQGTTTLAPGTYSVTIGQGGAGGSTALGGQAGNGGDTTAIGLTFVGGGSGGAQRSPVIAPRAGGSGGGGPGVNSDGGAGTTGQGFSGGRGAASGGAAGGGGGAGGAGANGVTNTSGGAGGVGVTSTITGTSRNIAGGGGGSTANGAAGTASHGGGAGTTGGSSGAANPGGNATGPGGGGGGAAGQSTGGNGFRGHFILRVKIA